MVFFGWKRLIHAPQAKIFEIRYENWSISLQFPLIVDAKSSKFSARCARENFWGDVHPHNFSRGDQSFLGGYLPIPAKFLNLA